MNTVFRHRIGFNCTKCETFVMTENPDWACLCQRCYHYQQPDIQDWIRLPDHASDQGG